MSFNVNVATRPHVSPKGLAGAGVGIGMVLVVGIPLIENKNITQMLQTEH